MTVRVNIGTTATTSSTSLTFALAGGAFASNQRGGSMNMPSVVPASELYFWSAKWQAEEKAFEQARDQGELHSFDSADAAIRALLSD